MKQKKTKERAFQPKPGRAKEAVVGRGAKRALGLIKSLTARHSGRLGVGARAGQNGVRNGATGRHKTVNNPSRLAQRVTVKGRFVKIRGNVRGIRAHMQYLQREGVARDGGDVQMFTDNQELSPSEAMEWAQTGASDRHQFRFIISPENGAQLDLKRYTRDLVRQMEQDLETGLTWIAVEHHDTDNPHVHLIVRGVAQDGKDLVISRDYMGHGIRGRASDIATRELGHRSEHEIRLGMTQDISKNRYTSLDADLERLAVKHPDNMIDLRPDKFPGGHYANVRRTLLINRAQHLKSLGLAYEARAGCWELAPNIRHTLRTMGEQDDIIKSMHNRMRGQERFPECVIFNKDSPEQPPITGVVLDKGLHNELYDTRYITVAATDGRTYYVPLADKSEVTMAEVAPGGMVQIQAVAPSNKIDPVLTQHSRQAAGVYDARIHAQSLVRTSGDNPLTPQEIIDKYYVPRLESLEKKGLVTRLDEHRWQIPADLEDKVRVFTQSARDAGRVVKVNTLSHLSPEQQIRAPGKTWLDEHLHEPLPTFRPKQASDIEQRIEAARKERLEYLRERGLTYDSPHGPLPKQGFQRVLYDQELADAHRQLAGQFGRGIQISPDVPFSGTLVGVHRMPSGHYGVIHDGAQHALVPWQADMHKHVGKSVTVGIGDPVQMRQRAQQQIRFRMTVMRGLDKGREL